MKKNVLFDQTIFTQEWGYWKEQYGDFLNEKTRKETGGWRYTHTRLRKAVRHIENALPYMFASKTYNHREIAPTSNKIEGYF
jgi:hypothetical protein